MQNLTFSLRHVLQYSQLVDVRHTENYSDGVVLYQIQEKLMKIFYQTAGKLIMLCLLPLLNGLCPFTFSGNRVKLRGFQG